MKKSLIKGMVVATSLVAPAMAADLPLKAPVAAPAVVAPSAYYWTGFYLGGNAGYGWGRTDDSVNGLPPPAFVGDPFGVGASPGGFLGGGQVGYNFQNQSIVYGIEADFDGANVKGRGLKAPLTFLGIPIPGSNSTIQTRLNSFGTIRGRLGVAVPGNSNLLIYATGGWAYDHLKDSSVTTFPALATTTYVGGTSGWQSGWAAGGGFEYALNEKWSFKIEYLYVDLGGRNYIASPLAPNPPFAVAHQLNDFTMHTVRAGINFKLN